MPDPEDKAAETNPYKTHVVGGGQEAYKGKANPCRASDRHAPLSAASHRRVSSLACREEMPPKLESTTLVLRV